jgi:hypothetical protein
MNARTSISSPTAFYDLFLYAPVCDQRNGTPLTVISALARLNKDPWEEAARITAMPKAALRKSWFRSLDKRPTLSGRNPKRCRSLCG